MKCVQLQRRKNPSIESRGVKPYADTPCGKCGQCLTNKGNEWKMRLNMESQYAHSTTFVTLTYQDSEIPYSEQSLETVVKSHLQKFIKRVRKHQDTNKSLKKNWAKTCKALRHTDTEIKKIRYYSVGEYGGRFGRPHYHITFFNLYPPTRNALQKLWTDPQTGNPYGSIDIITIDTGHIDYISKFHINKHAKGRNKKDGYTEWVKGKQITHLPQRQPPFSLMSLKPALGTEGIMAKKQEIYDTDLLTLNGIPQRLPQVFKDKLYPNEWAQIDLKARKSHFAKLGEMKQIRKLQKDGFTRPLLELEDRAEAQNKMLIKKASKH